jgi:gamma-glutamylcyclotransferase (GGCT)/AIG2-like uncharacterized protein YtfP
MELEYLFSYGTLLPSHAPAEIADTMRNLRRLGRGSVRGRLYDLGEYPGAVLQDGEARIFGEVFQLPAGQEMLQELDEYEGFNPADPVGSLFLRKKCPVVLDSGKQIACWVYVYNRDPGAAPLVYNGDYSATKTARR